MYSRLSHSARWDLKLNIFRVLKAAPISSVRSRFLRSYYGRLRMHTKADFEAVFAKLPPNPVIVDLGANDALFVPELVLSNAAEIHAVEPDPAIFELLRKSVASLKNVFLYNAAIGATDGWVEFYRAAQFDPQDPVKHSMMASTFKHPDVNVVAPLTLPQIGILTLLEKIGKPVDLMKVDIEGAEVPMLETLLSSPLAQNISIMLVETHEHMFPELVDRTHAIRKRVNALSGPQIDMNWH
jgi:FkbM family methyltransferase